MNITLRFLINGGFIIDGFSVYVFSVIYTHALKNRQISGGKTCMVIHEEVAYFLDILCSTNQIELKFSLKVSCL